MKTVLDVNNIVKDYGSFRALDVSSLSVGADEFHGLIGPNGSGKSTFMKCVAGSVAPSSGQIFLNGRDVSSDGAAARARAGLSIKFQVTSIIESMTLFDNVLLAEQSGKPLRHLLHSPRADKKAMVASVMANLEQFHLADRAFDRGSTLSHGEQQWLEIAMTLATRPKLLLLDEPTAGMSVEERRMTGALLQRLRGRVAIIIVEHDLDFVRDICDRLTVLDQGQVLKTGTISEVQNSENVKKVYLRRV